MTKQKCIVWCVVVFVIVCGAGWIYDLETTTETTSTEFTYYTSKELGVMMKTVIAIERTKGAYDHE